MKPTIGRIVHYKLNDAEKEQLKDAEEFNNPVSDEDVFPAIIVAVFSNDIVNLKVIVDGETDFIWATSREEGDGAGEWQWPTKE